MFPDQFQDGANLLAKSRVGLAVDRACKPGMQFYKYWFQWGGGGFCLQCDSGTFSDAYGAVDRTPNACQTCPSNTSSLAGETRCTPCARGLVSEPGASSCYSPWGAPGAAAALHHAAKGKSPTVQLLSAGAPRALASLALAAAVLAVAATSD